MEKLRQTEEKNGRMKSSLDRLLRSHARRRFLFMSGRLTGCPRLARNGTSRSPHPCWPPSARPARSPARSAAFAKSSSARWGWRAAAGAAPCATTFRAALEQHCRRGATAKGCCTAAAAALALRTAAAAAAAVFACGARSSAVARTLAVAALVAAVAEVGRRGGLTMGCSFGPEVLVEAGLAPEEVGNSSRMQAVGSTGSLAADSSQATQGIAAGKETAAEHTVVAAADSTAAAGTIENILAAAGKSTAAEANTVAAGSSAGKVETNSPQPSGSDSPVDTRRITPECVGFRTNC